MAGTACCSDGLCGGRVDVRSLGRCEERKDRSESDRIRWCAYTPDHLGMGHSRLFPNRSRLGNRICGDFRMADLVASVGRVLGLSSRATDCLGLRDVNPSAVPFADQRRTGRDSVASVSRAGCGIRCGVHRGDSFSVGLLTNGPTLSALHGGGVIMEDRAMRYISCPGRMPVGGRGTDGLGGILRSSDTARRHFRCGGQ